MRQKNEKLKVYEFLYNRLPFSDNETEEYEAMQRMDLLEEHFDLYLRKINTKNMELHWHCEVVVGTEHEMINVLIATEYCYYLFVLHDYSGEHYINPFNILINKQYEAVYDLNRTAKIYDKFKESLIDEGSFQRPIIIKHVVIDRKSTRLNSSHVSISYAVFCLKKKKRYKKSITNNNRQVWICRNMT